MKACLIMLLLVGSTAIGQTVTTNVPRQIKKSEKYLFYLHGGVVTILGNDAINQSMPEWGPYQYLSILDSLRNRGFNVISENRKEGVADSVYVNKIVFQIDSMLKAKASTKNIVVVGASSGWDIAIRASAKLKNNKLNFVIMGGCWPDTYKDYIETDIYGNFLSIVEESDPHKTCYKIFENRKHLRSSKEITLNTGLSHGFFYKGYKHWMDPIVQWIEKK